MAANRKRTPFNPAGPFLARKNFSIFDTKLEVGKTYPASVFARLHERRLQQLFDANYINMGAADAKLSKPKVGAHPLDRDGSGGPGGSLTELEQKALADAGFSVDEWLKLPDPERTQALADALSRAGGASAPSSPEGKGEHGGASGGDGGADEQAAGGPETAPAAPAAASGDPDGAKAPEGAKIAAYKHFGFGRWFAIDADGKKIGDKVSKTEAEQQAAVHNVPLEGVLS